MRTVGTLLLVLGTLAGVWAVPAPVVRRPMCDSSEVEEAAAVALDYINSIQKHGYKYALNRIEEAKVTSLPTGGEMYILELDLLQTTCHVMDPMPLMNCTVRPKIHMTFEGDCDVAVKKLDGVLSMKAFKCKSKQSKPDSREGMCVGCPILLPLNDTDALLVVEATLAAFNRQSNSTFALLEVARLTSQVVGGGAKTDTEFIVVETNCSSKDTESCVPLQGPETHYGICQSSSIGLPGFSVSCKVFTIPPPPVAPATNSTNSTEAVPPPAPAQPSPPLGDVHHKLILLHLHDPSGAGLLSESHESGEVTVAQVPGPVVKRDAPVPDAGPPEEASPLFQGLAIQFCPGRLRHF